MKKVLRRVFWALLGVVALGAVLFGYFVYSPAPAIPQLSGAVTRGAIAVGGLTRSYRTYVPRGLARGAPLVVVMHGAGENGGRIRIETGYAFDRLADAHGFAVVYPNAYEGFWDVCTVVGAVQVDDVGFLTAMVDQLAGEIGVDPRRVFATGVSRGGFMAYRLALEAPARFRAVAAVSANVPSPENFTCKAAGAGTSSVMIMNGTSDPLVPFDGGSVSVYGLFYKLGKVRSSRESAQYFADLNHLTGPPWRNQNVEVQLVVVQGGGHGIPQPYYRHPRLLGPSLREPNGPEVIWEFFHRHDVEK
jgi:polyhydroxybutyrate depolymerase